MKKLLLIAVLFAGCKSEIKIKPHPYIWNVNLHSNDTLYISCRNIKFGVEHDSSKFDAWGDTANFLVINKSDTVYIHDTIYRNKIVNTNIDHVETLNQ